MSRLLTVFALVLATGLLSACDSDEPAAPTEPSPTEITEAFSGTLTVNGAVTHPFVVQRAGTATARLTALAPDAAAVIGLSLGTWNGQACQIIIANDAATTTTASTVTGTASAGNFCVRVYDVGRLTAATTYELTVTHF